MRFPTVPRVVYRRTSLVEVICQVKFTPVLKIQTEAPVEVQEALRGDLPGYSITRHVIPFLVEGGPPMTPTVEYAFVSTDGGTRVTLGSDFVALSVRNYQRWETFEALLLRALDVVQRTYQPHGFTRIGLRYQNVVRPDQLGLEGVPWSELVHPALLGMLAGEPDWRPTAGSREELYALEVAGAPGTGRIIHGTVVDGQGREAYLIDSDLFVERPVAPGGERAVLDDLHGQSRSFFRHCVQDRLHQAMQPEGN